MSRVYEDVREKIEQGAQAVFSSTERMVEIGARHRSAFSAMEIEELRASAYTLLALCDELQKHEAAE